MLDCKQIYDVLATSILETISPTRCAVCDAPGQVLCSECALNLPFIDLDLACPRCGAPFGHWLCTECPNPGSEEERLRTDDRFAFSAARAALSFEAGARNIIRTYKDGDELRLDKILAELLCNAMQGNSGAKHQEEDGIARMPDWTLWADALTYIPASPEAVKRRGFDHMARIAAICSDIAGLRLVNVLKGQKGGLDQRELGRSGRIANKAGAFKASLGSEPPPKHMILIDDVFTTGATLHAGASALIEAGVKEVYALVCARVW